MLSRKRCNSDAKRPMSKALLVLESLEDRFVPANVAADYAVLTAWNSGFQADVQLTNQAPTTVEDWTLEFDFASDISSIWNATVVSHVGDHYVVRGASWNEDLYGNSTVSFGFIAGPDSTVPFENLILNGQPLDGDEEPEPTPPSLTVANIDVDETSDIATFSLELSAAATEPITVDFATSDGTATAGNDYESTSGTVTFNPGQLSALLSIAIVDDVLVEDPETFLLTLSKANGAVLDQDSAAATIFSEDVPETETPSGDVEFSVDSDWGSAFTGSIAINNSTDEAIEDWTLEFDFAGTISSIWNAKIVSHSGDHYVVAPESWNASIAVGGSVNFGFVASPGSGAVAPTNYELNGTSVPTDDADDTDDTDDTDTGDQEPNVLAANDDFWQALADQPATLNVLANDTAADGTLSIDNISQPGSGSVVINDDGTVTYTPDAGFLGVDSFSYTVTDASGATATANVQVNVVEDGSIWPESVFAPYVDMLLYPTFDLAAAARDQGIKYFSLAFITASSSGEAAWGGYDVYTVGAGSDYEANLQNQISEVRQMGGDVMISFGGAAGQEIAEVIPDVDALQAEYQQVIDDYQLTRIDFDIEGAALLHQDVIDRRSQAIAGLQQEAAAEGRELYVAFTLPVLPSGLTPGGVYVLESALRYGVRIDEVNIMTMDYGDAAAPNPDGQMGEYAIEAANSLFTQIQSVYNNAGMPRTDEQIWSQIAVTPMIGLNDVTTETFYLEDAQEVVDFAREKGLARIAMWSLNRDRFDPSVTNYVSITSSSVPQDPFDFSQVFIGLMETSD